MFKCEWDLVKKLGTMTEQGVLIWTDESTPSSTNFVAAYETVCEIVRIKTEWLEWLEGNKPWINIKVGTKIGFHTDFTFQDRALSTLMHKIMTSCKKEKRKFKLPTITMSERKRAAKIILGHLNKK